MQSFSSLFITDLELMGGKIGVYLLFPEGDECSVIPNFRIEGRQWSSEEYEWVVFGVRRHSPTFIRRV
jgi:hypothetical protein